VDKHEYQFDKIVVGNSLGALLLGYREGCPVITLNSSEPLFYEHFSPDVDLSFLGIDNRKRVLTTEASEIEVGIEKSKVYTRLVMLMSLAGLLPFAGSGISMRPAGDRKARMILDRARSVTFSYNNAIIVGNNLLEPSTSPEKYEVLDWMDVRSGMVHQFDTIENEADFVNRIHFYPSERVDGNHNKKDLVSVSYLTKEQLHSYEYSDTYARFSILHRMRNLGIRGARNGRDTKNPEKYKYYALKIETNRREVRTAEPLVDVLPRPTTHKYLKYLTETM